MSNCEHGVKFFFFLSTKWSFFNFFPAEGYLNCCQFLVTINKVIINVQVWVLCVNGNFHSSCIDTQGWHCQGMWWSYVCHTSLPSCSPKWLTVAFSIVYENSFSIISSPSYVFITYLFIHSIECLLIASVVSTLGDQMDCSLCPWDSPGKNTGVGCCALLQGIFRPRD